TVVVTQWLFKGEKAARRDSEKGCLSSMSEFEHGGFASLSGRRERRSAEAAPAPGDEEGPWDRLAIPRPFPVVGVTGFEPATLPSRTARATKLRHTPVVTRRNVSPRRNFSRHPGCSPHRRGLRSPQREQGRLGRGEQTIVRVRARAHARADVQRHPLPGGQAAGLPAGEIAV